MAIDINKVTGFAGFLGSLILAVCCTVPTIPHPLGQDGAFSFLNHFMSELGYFRSSKLAPVYNGGIFVGSFTLILFTAGLGHHFRTRLGYAAAICGILAGAACGLLGFFPVNRLIPHLTLAYIFFVTWPVAVGLFTWQILREPADSPFRGLLIPSVISLLLFALFLAMPFMIGMRRILEIDLKHFVRPTFIFTAVLEWLLFLSVLVWIVLASVKLVSYRSEICPPDNE